MVGISAGDQVRVFDTDCGKIAIQICYDIEFLSLLELQLTKERKLFSLHSVQKTVKAIYEYVTVRRREQLKIRYIRSFLERSETFRKQKTWMSNMHNQQSLHHLILNSQEMAL